MTAGYSGTPLGRKLGLRDGMRVWFAGMPVSVRAEIERETSGLIELADAAPGLDTAHIFVTRRADLESEIARLRPLLAAAGQLWVSWPKKAAKVETDITEDVIRAAALPTGLVDVKVCAVDQVWSGLKLVIRKEHRL